MIQSPKASTDGGLDRTPQSTIDSHCHLDFPEFAAELPSVIDRAKRAGVDRMITISTSVPRYDAYREIAESYAEVYFTVGTHPHRAHEDSETSVDRLVELAQHPKCVGIGEAGLDYHYDRSPRDVAERVFRTHIAAARLSGLPLVIHTRDADADTARILREEMEKGPFSAVLHCFTSSEALAKTGIELGLFISFSGVLTFKNSQSVRETAQWAPIDRVLVETDSPFLSPVPHRGRRNEPSYVVETLKTLAALKGLDIETAQRTVRSATLTLFSKMKADMSGRGATPP